MYSSYATVTLACPLGMSGSNVTQGSAAESVISQRDADVRAQEAARAMAYEHLVCTNPVVPPDPVFFSDAVSAFAYSEAGYVTQTFSVTYAAGAVYSLVSAADATAAAQESAQAAADHNRDTMQKLIYYNDEQSYSNSCDGLIGGGYAPLTYSVTKTAGTYSSNTSKAAANLAAYTAAKNEVAAYLATNCFQLFYSAAAEYTATCGGGLVGDPVTITYSPGAFVGSSSQSAVNSVAVSTAKVAAEAVIVCAAGFWNVAKSSVQTCNGAYGVGWVGENASAVVSASTVHDTTQSAADSRALSMAVVSAVENLRCNWNGGPLP